MDEGLNHLYEDNFGLSSSLNKFKEMLRGEEPRFFDVQEFEDIIEYYTDQQNFKYADTALQYANKIHPSSSNIKLKEARLCIEKGDLNIAIGILDKIEAIEHKNADLFFLKGLAYFSLNELGEAHNNFESAIELTEDPEDKEDMLYQVALNILQLEKFDEAITYLNRAYEANNENLLVIYELANCYEAMGKFEDSARYYTIYLDKDPFSESIWNALGIAYAADNLIDKAREAFDFAIAINPMYTSPFINKANIFIKKGNNREAIKIYEELISLDRDNVQNYYLIGECYEKTNHIIMALEYYNKAVEIDETYADAWFGIGNIYAGLNQHSRCITYFEKAIEYDEENPDFWYNLGVAQLKNNQYHNALFAFERVLLIDKYDAEAWVEQAKILILQNKLNDAVSILSKAYHYNSDSASVNYQLAIVYFINKELPLSIKFLKQALHLDFGTYSDVLKDYPEMLEHSQFIETIKNYA